MSMIASITHTISTAPLPLKNPTKRAINPKPLKNKLNNLCFMKDINPIYHSATWLFKNFVA